MTDKTFINRWSQTKLAEKEKIVEPEQIPEALEQSATLPVAVEGATESLEDQIPPDLPSIESLDGDSDYSVFMGKNVPEELARLALRKLWGSDPVFANLDGLNDYDEDYSSLGIVKTVVETAYKVGKGIVSDEEAEIEEDSVEELPVEDDAVVEEESEVSADEQPVQLADVSDAPVPHGEKH